MKKHILTLLCTAALVWPMYAEEIINDTSAEGVINDASAEGEEISATDAALDSLFRRWYNQYFTQSDDFCHDDDENVTCPDSIYRQRIKRLEYLIPMTYNETVRRYLNIYVNQRRDVVRYMLGLADYYFPLIEPIFEQYGLPQELKYLPIVESAMNPIAISRVGASGFWQFMLPTGKSYGLEINSLVDERRDPVKSTEAACRYFRDVYNLYGDWHLVLASFNCGPGNVNKAIRRAGGKKDFWAIYRYLPSETRSYVPLYIAAAYIMNYHCEHNLCSVRTTLPLATDTIIIDRTLHFEQLSALLHVDIDLLRMLNPQYIRDIVPGHIHPSVVRLPAAEAYSFIDLEDSIYQYRADELLAGALQPNEIHANKALLSERITYTTRSRESLHLIGSRYGVTARDIRRWNNLSSNRVPAGKRLVLHVNNGGVRHNPSPTRPAISKASGTTTYIPPSHPAHPLGIETR